MTFNGAIDFIFPARAVNQLHVDRDGLTGGGAWWLRNDPTGGAGDGELAAHALWWPPSKIAGRWLSPYLAERDEAAAAEAPHGTPLEVRLAHSRGPVRFEASTAHPIDVLAVERMARPNP